jgi:hypothetical protein
MPSSLSDNPSANNLITVLITTKAIKQSSRDCFTAFFFSKHYHFDLMADQMYNIHDYPFFK